MNKIIFNQTASDLLFRVQYVGADDLRFGKEKLYESIRKPELFAALYWDKYGKHWRTILLLL